MEHMKYLWKRPFGVCFISVFETRHFENWKRQKILNSELHISTFPTFQTFFGGCWGCTVEKGMMWLWSDLLKTYFTELIQLKYKLILWIKTMGCCGLACVVWLKSCKFSKSKSVLIVGKSSMMCLLQTFLNLTYMWTFLFCMKMSELVWYFYYLWKAQSIWKKSKPLKQLFDALDTNSLTLMTVLKIFSEIFL